MFATKISFKHSIFTVVLEKLTPASHLEVGIWSRGVRIYYKQHSSVGLGGQAAACPIAERIVKTIGMKGADNDLVTAIRMFGTL